MQKYLWGVRIKLQSPLKRLETGLKGGITNMINVKRKEAGKESISKFGTWCFLYLLSSQLVYSD